MYDQIPKAAGEMTDTASFIPSLSLKVLYQKPEAPASLTPESQNQ